MRNREVDFVVEGSGEFPVDMLRYDSCYPVNEQAVWRIVPRYGLDGEADKLGRRQVMLRTTNTFGPTVKRWESFNWKVILNDAE